MNFEDFIRKKEVFSQPDVPRLRVSSGKLKKNVIRNSKVQSIFQERQNQLLRETAVIARLFPRLFWQVS